MEREARAKALEQSRVEEEERRKKALEEEEQRQRQLLLLQEQKKFLQEPELQQAGISGTSTSEHVHESSQVPVKRKRGRKKKIVQEPLENNLNREEQQQSQLKSADSQLDSSAVSGTEVTDIIHNSSIVGTCPAQPSLPIDVHDKDAITMMENEPVTGRLELRLLSDISRDKWMGTIVYFDEKGDMVNSFLLLQINLALDSIHYPHSFAGSSYRSWQWLDNSSLSGWLVAAVSALQFRGS